MTGSRELPPTERPNSTVLVRTGATIGICSVSTSGTWLLSLAPQLLAMVSVLPGASTLGTELTTRNSMIGPMHRIVRNARQRLGQRQRPLPARGRRRASSSRLTSLMLELTGNDREVDDDVVALGDALLVERGQRDRVDHQVAVVGDELERHRLPLVVGQRQLPEPRHARQ